MTVRDNTETPQAKRFFQDYITFNVRKLFRRGTAEMSVHLVVSLVQRVNGGTRALFGKVRQRVKVCQNNRENKSGTSRAMRNMLHDHLLYTETLASYPYSYPTFFYNLRIRHILAVTVYTGS